MTGLPRWLLTHTMTVEPFLGASGHGPQYGPPVVVACFVEHTSRTVRGRDGRELVARTTVYAPHDTEIGPDARVTVDGQSVEVLAVTRHDGSGLPTPDHLEISCQ
jgi:hypothetical protein